MGRGRSLRYPTAGTKRPLNSQRVLLPELFQQTSTNYSDKERKRDRYEEESLLWTEFIYQENISKMRIFTLLSLHLCGITSAQDTDKVRQVSLGLYVPIITIIIHLFNFLS